MKEMTFGNYLSDLKTKHAVKRNFSIIGEAVARIDKAFREHIVHDYFGIDDTIVWDIIQIDLAPFEGDIRIVLASITN